MVSVLLCFLLLSTVLYVVVGGADFGVGVLESVTRGEARALVQKQGAKAIAPVWEANHIWMIIGLVILFVGFPGVHYQMMTTLHLPMVGMLIGIILRGTAFTFRYYQLGDLPGSIEKIWTPLFRAGSFVTAFFFGVMAASLSRGRIDPTATDFGDAFVHPWLGVFPIMTGIFVIALFAWLAAVFLVGEAKLKDRPTFVTIARRATLCMMLVGFGVTASAWLEANPVLASPSHLGAQVAIVVLATALLGWLYRLLDSTQIWITRLVAGAVTLLVVVGYVVALFPRAILLREGEILWADAAAPEATIVSLVVALTLGSIVILPGIFWLYKIFKTSTADTPG